MGYLSAKKRPSKLTAFDFQCLPWKSVFIVVEFLRDTSEPSISFNQLNLMISGIGAESL
jgi:hypothetical protein